MLLLFLSTLWLKSDITYITMRFTPHHSATLRSGSLKLAGELNVRAACGGKVSTLLGGGTIIPFAIN
jgi:hypothetical protein